MTNDDDRKPTLTHETSQPAALGEWAFTHDGDQRLARVSGYGRAQLELVDGSLHVGIAPDGSPSIVINSSSLETVATLRLPKPKPTDVPSSEWAALFARVFAIETPANPAEAELAIAELFERPGHFGRFDSGAAPAAQLRALIMHSRAISGCVQLLDQQLGTNIEGELGNDEIVYELRKSFARLAALASGRDEFGPEMISEALTEFEADDHGLQAEIIRARARWIPSAESKVGDGWQSLPRNGLGPTNSVLEVSGGVVLRSRDATGSSMVFVAGETVLSVRQRFGYGDPESSIDPK
jgi:hypothetical protein